LTSKLIYYKLFIIKSLYEIFAMMVFNPGIKTGFWWSDFNEIYSIRF